MQSFTTEPFGYSSDEYGSNGQSQDHYEMHQLNVSGHYKFYMWIVECVIDSNL